MSESVLIADETLGYGAAVVLSGVTFTLRPQERIVLLGRSGAGKSTLLSTIYRRLADRGERVALVPQDQALVPQLSAFHNVYMGRLDRHSPFYNLANLCWPMAVERAGVAAALSAVGLEGQVWQHIEQMSGGQKQRVAVARAIFRGGNVLIADEPVSAVDGAQAIRLLTEIEERFPTTIVALHDVDLALSHGTRVIGLKGCRIAFDRPRNELTRGAIDDLYRV